MKENFIPALRLTLVCAVFFLGIYMGIVLLMTPFAPNGGRGAVLDFDGKKMYENIAQEFVQEKYFYSRPSAVGYNAAGAGGSNKAVSNPDYLMDIQSRIDTLIAQHPNIDKADIPSDLVTASGSGLDPHISVPAAKIQVQRIAKSRNIDAEQIQRIIEANTEAPLFGLLGTERINVLKLNLALDKIK